MPAYVCVNECVKRQGDDSDGQEEKDAVEEKNCTVHKGLSFK